MYCLLNTVLLVQNALLRKIVKQRAWQKRFTTDVIADVTLHVTLPN